MICDFSVMGRQEANFSHVALSKGSRPEDCWIALAILGAFRFCGS